MREILFRGKRADNGEWVYGYYTELPVGSLGATIFSNDDEIVCEDTASYIIKVFEKQHSNYSNGNPLQVIECENYEVIPETVGQYTGLTDKNGKKIFEGDILKCHDKPKDLVKVVFGGFDVVDTDTECPVDTVIGWHYEVIPTDELSAVEPFCLSMPLTKSYIEYFHMEVIGNIHDNPELLEVSE